MDQRKLQNQLRYLEGQIGGITRMLDEGRPPSDVLIQLRALAAGARRAVDLGAEGVAREALRADLERQLAACPGVCDYCDQVLALFDELDLKPLLRAIAS